MMQFDKSKIVTNYKNLYLKYKYKITSLQNGGNPDEKEKLYHGTSLYFFESIREKGLTGRSNNNIFIVYVKAWGGKFVEKCSNNWKFIEFYKDLSKQNTNKLTFLTKDLAYAQNYATGSLGEGVSAFIGCLKDHMHNFSECEIFAEIYNNYIEITNENPGIIFVVRMMDFPPNFFVHGGDKAEYTTTHVIPPEKIYILITDEKTKEQKEVLIQSDEANIYVNKIREQYKSRSNKKAKYVCPSIIIDEEKAKAERKAKQELDRKNINFDVIYDNDILKILPNLNNDDKIKFKNFYEYVYSQEIEKGNYVDAEDKARAEMIAKAKQKAKRAEISRYFNENIYDEILKIFPNLKDNDIEKGVLNGVYETAYMKEIKNGKEESEAIQLAKNALIDRLENAEKYELTQFFHEKFKSDLEKDPKKNAENILNNFIEYYKNYKKVYLEIIKEEKVVPVYNKKYTRLLNLILNSTDQFIYLLYFNSMGIENFLNCFFSNVSEDFKQKFIEYCAYSDFIENFTFPDEYERLLNKCIHENPKSYYNTGKIKKAVPAIIQYFDIKS
jgi:hypothetical protein